MGSKHIKWTKEQQDKLLREIQTGKTYVQLSIAMNMGVTYIWTKIKEMGFEGLKDAREVLADY